MTAQLAHAPTERVLAPLSLDALILGAARLRPQAIAFLDRTTACSFAVAAAHMSAMARLLSECGLKRGERLLLTGGAEVSLLIGLAAAVRGGFEPGLAPLGLNPQELAAYARALGAAAIVGPTDYGELKPVETYFAAAAEAPGVRLVATLGPGEADGALDLGALALAHYAAARPEDATSAAQPAPAAVPILTLDRHRLAPVAHDQTTLMTAALDFITRAEIGRGAPIFSTLPPTNFVGLAAGLFAALLSGATLHMDGPFSADDFLRARDRAGSAHLVVPAAITADLSAAGVLDGLASAVLVSHHSGDAGFVPPPPFVSSCPLLDLYAVDECAAVVEPRRGPRAVPPACEPHFIGVEDSRVLSIERLSGHALRFRGAAVSGGRTDERGPMDMSA